MVRLEMGGVLDGRCFLQQLVCFKLSTLKELGVSIHAAVNGSQEM